MHTKPPLCQGKPPHQPHRFAEAVTTDRDRAAGRAKVVIANLDPGLRVSVTANASPQAGHASLVS
jgi:hypothetical protein